jgi:hypothetical protein
VSLGEEERGRDLRSSQFVQQRIPVPIYIEGVAGVLISLGMTYAAVLVARSLWWAITNLLRDIGLAISKRPSL